MRRRPLDSRAATRVLALVLRALLPRVLGLAVLGALVTSVVAAGRVLPVAVPAPAPVADGAPPAAQVDPGGAPPAAAAASASPSAPPPPSSRPSSRPSSAPAPSRSPVAGADPAATSASRRQLPRGGTSVFPRYRLVGFSGGPGTEAFGRLGIGDLDQRVAEIEGIATRYAAGREPMPVLELIAVIAQPKPGADGLYRVRVDDAVIRTYLAAARRHRAMLLLNIQPGRADFLDEVKAMERWLREPDVGLALDPEWAVGRREVPGRVFGSTTGAELDRVARYVADLVIANRLPEKVVVVHQLAPRVLRDSQALQPHWGVVVVKSVDGIGSRSEKTSTWRRLVDGMPEVLHPGFKLFYVEDAGSGPLMTPRQVLELRPTPEYVLYE